MRTLKRSVCVWAYECNPIQHDSRRPAARLRCRWSAKPPTPSPRRCPSRVSRANRNDARPCAGSEHRARDMCRGVACARRQLDRRRGRVEGRRADELAGGQDCAAHGVGGRWLQAVLSARRLRVETRVSNAPLPDSFSFCLSTFLYSRSACSWCLTGAGRIHRLGGSDHAFSNVPLVSA